MAIGLNRLGAAAHSNTPPAIIQAAHNFAWFVQALKDCEDRHDKEVDGILAEFKASGTWREHYKTWDAACQYALGISKSYADKRIAKSLGQTAPTGAKSPNKEDKKEEAALKKVEELRQEPKEEEPEKPAVHSADEVKRDEPKPANNGQTKPTQNGKPKTSLAIWNELEEDIFGRAFRRVDDLNRQCPNAFHHKGLITALKMCYGILNEWKRDTK